ncbi:hypothetical protein OG21DRAFT_385150 [Imleria badia]|nr:hypothetical protein OG21DRAFT_385150 [Imleria badia]
MHHALEIQEILSLIFSHYPRPALSLYRHEHVDSTSDLAGLARTCRAFKEPALDALWSALFDSSPLARCLPEASHGISPENLYSFSRPLMQTESGILQSYTCRIRSIRDFTIGLDWKSVTTFLNPPTTGPLFPDLCSLRGEYTENTMPLLNMPFPSLLTLNLKFENPHLF